MDKVTGIVEAIGTKFNGSLKVNGSWHNLKKGVPYSHVKSGDHVSLSLTEWDFKGKKGVSVSAVDVVGVATQVKVPAGNSGVEASAKSATPKGRDFDGEAKGKTRCQLFSAALRSPALAQLSSGLSMDEFMSLVLQAAARGVDYTFEGK